MKCSICSNEIEVEPSGWDGGHNAWPINDGRCCSACNSSRVVPERIRRMTSKPKLAVDQAYKVK